MNRKQAWLGVLISAAFLYLAFRKTDWSQTIRVLQAVDYFWIVVSLPVLFLAFWFRALRWRYLLMPSGRPGLHSLFGAVMIGFMSLNLLPFRLGEFIRAYVLGRREGMSKTGVFATVVLERVFDGISVLLLLIVSLFLQPIPLSDGVMAWVRAFSYLAVLIFVGAVVFLVLAKMNTRLLILIAERVLTPFPRLKHKAEQLILAFVGGLDALGSARLLGMVLFYSALVWLATTVYYWMVMFGFQSADGVPMGAQVGPVGSMFVLAAVALGIMIPSSPGFVGTFELACITAVAALGVDKSAAQTYAIVVHLAQFLPVTLTGILYLYLQNFSLREIKRGGEAAKGEIDLTR